MYTPSYPSERRKAKRFIWEVEAQLSADLALLDSSQGGVQAEPLLLLGATRDVSVLGVGLVVPSIRIDETFCSQPHLMPLSLHLSSGSVEFTVKAVHSQPIVSNDPDMGYVVGLRIVDFQKSGPTWQQYLSSLAV